eukprot:TRINITY_DN16718_c0_g1_i1.p1 TRINITY_DN16718_c0_g1~~TRINITY_DN16718_c0_g1_i1.p1  ORF type:complete len:327 (+),score=47.39 TRINITY_DN16718_c0_g1_i1:2-982(+)
MLPAFPCNSSMHVMAVQWLLVLPMFLMVRVAAKGDETCWEPGVTWESCCAPAFGPEGNPACWGGDYTYERCCGLPDYPSEPPAALDPSAGSQAYPGCTVKDVVLRHAGEHGVFADLSIYSSSGCFQNNCGKTDKFTAADSGICARACAEVEACNFWSHGKQDGVKKCFLRSSDVVRDHGHGWTSGVKACGPSKLPDGFVAHATANAEALKACDAGKGEQCPDVAAAINTWLFAIKHLKQAFEGRVDPDTWHHVTQIGVDSQNFKAGLTSEYRPTDKDFPRVIYNNRLIFNHLDESLRQHGQVEINPQDVFCSHDGCHPARGLHTDR